MIAKPGMPFANTRIAEYLTKTIENGTKTQRQIAQEIGYEHSNMISMFKRGETKVPLDKIPLLAKSLDIDTAHLFRLAMEQSWGNPGIVAEVFGTVLSKNELSIINLMRETTNDRDPELTPDLKRKLETIFSSSEAG
jgi:transcriptional regulator with XRE-family HTH domain